MKVIIFLVQNKNSLNTSCYYPTNQMDPIHSAFAKITEFTEDSVEVGDQVLCYMLYRKSLLNLPIS